MKALIDGDLLIYKAAFNAETSVAWDADIFAVQANMSLAKEGFGNAIANIVKHTDAKEVKVAISCPTDLNFRRNVWPAYKEQRNPQGRRSAKPTLYKQMRDHVRVEYDCVEKPNMEADDVLGIMATRGGYGQDRVIASIDKDMYTIPGLHFDWRTPQRGIFAISREEARRAFYMQVLTGDSTDNYPGCPGVGPVNAKRLLQHCDAPDEYWAVVCRVYEKHKLTEDDAIVQARCARILRACDYDFDKKEIRLWTPLRGE